MNMLRTTVIGGVVFLIPVIIVVAIFGRAFRFMMKVIAPLEKAIPLGSVAGVAVINILAIIALFVLCFLAGLVAKSNVARKAVSKLEGGLLMAIPGYNFIKAVTGSLGGEEGEEHMIPVFVRFDDLAQVAFEVERAEDGQVVVYLPGAPNATSGSVILMEPDRVTRIEASVAKTMRSMRSLGKGSAELLGH